MTQTMTTVEAASELAKHLPAGWKVGSIDGTPDAVPIYDHTGQPIEDSLYYFDQRPESMDEEDDYGNVYWHGEGCYTDRSGAWLFVGPDAEMVRDFLDELPLSESRYPYSPEFRH